MNRIYLKTFTNFVIWFSGQEELDLSCELTSGLECDSGSPTRKRHREICLTIMNFMTWVDGSYSHVNFY